MFENIDELIEVNLKLLYASKSQFMMRINFKDEFGFNLKNSKVFAEVLNNKGLIKLEETQGFRCDLTELGKQIYENGGWNKYIRTVEPFAEYHTDEITDFQTKKTFPKRIMFASIIVLLLFIFIAIIQFKH
jgi:hypothetical protein